MSEATVEKSKNQIFWPAFLGLIALLVAFFAPFIDPKLLANGREDITMLMLVSAFSTVAAFICGVVLLMRKKLFVGFIVMLGCILLVLRGVGLYLLVGLLDAIWPA